MLANANVLATTSHLLPTLAMLVSLFPHTRATSLFPHTRATGRGGWMVAEAEVAGDVAEAEVYVEV